MKRQQCELVPFFVGDFIHAEELRVRREGFALDLRLVTDYALRPDLSFSPSIGVFGGKTADSYDFSTELIGSGTSFVRHQVNERVRSDEIGADVRGTLIWHFYPGFALEASGRAGVVWLRSRLTGDDCLNFGLAPPGFPCGPGAPMVSTFLTSSASDRDSTVGFRGGASLALAVDLRFAVATIGGFFRYDSRLPGIDNPQAPVPLFGMGPGTRCPACASTTASAMAASSGSRCRSCG